MEDKVMRKLIYIIFLLGSIGLVFSIVQAQNTGVYGCVTSSSGGIFDVHVVAYTGPPFYGQLAGESSTDTNGCYSLSLQPGSYKLAFYAPLGGPHIYVDQWYDNKFSQFPANVFSLASGDMKLISPTLASGGKISGKVTSDGINGISQIMVQIFQCDSAPTCFHTNPLLLQVPTDESGNYWAVVPGGSDVDPKKYWLIFNSYDGPPNGINYLPQGYNNKKPWSHDTVPNPDPDLVTVVNDQYATYTDSNNVTTTSIDAQLDPGVVVTGTVYDSDTTPSTPINDAHIAAHLDDVWAYETMTGRYPTSPGRYFITIPPDDGSYIQVFGGPNNYILGQRIYLLNPLSAHVNNVPIFQPDISSNPAYNPTYTNQTYQPDVDFYIANKGGKITGIVKDAETGSPISKACVGVLDENGNWLTGSEGLTSATGSFTTPTLEVGPNYRLTVNKCQASDNYFYPGYYNGIVQVTRGKTTDPIEIGLTNRVGTIFVTLTNNSERGIRNVNVEARLDGNLVAEGLTDINGQAFLTVAAGKNYTINYNTYDSEGYYLSRSRGNPIFVPDNGIAISDRLTTGSQVTIDVKLGINPNLLKTCEETFTAAILSTNDLKASKINIGTVTLQGTTPSSSTLQDVNNDGKPDLVLTFPKSAFNLTSYPSSVVLNLSATIIDYSGIPIQVTGSDYIIAYDTIKPPTIFDDFSSGIIDTSKWSFTAPNLNPPLLVSTDGKLIIENSIANSASSKGSGLLFKNPIGINSYKAKVKILAFDNPNGGLATAELGGFFYNDTFSTPNYTSGEGNIFARVSIGGYGTTPIARYGIIRTKDKNYTQFETLKTDIIPVPINVSDEHTLFIRWNGSEFTFSVDNVEVQYPVSSLDNKNIYPASNISKYVRTTLTPPSPGTTYSATVKASFDDIEVPAMANYTPSCATEQVQVQPIDTSTGQNPVTIMYDQVTQSGVTTLSTSDTGPIAPSGFQIGDPPIYYNLSTTATVSGGTVCINYLGLSYTDESQLRLLHYQNNAWTDITISGYPDMGNKIICGEATSFSPFAVMEDKRIKVWVDIKPGSDLNSINLGSQGLTPVAILSTAAFYATGIDPKTVTFAGISPTKWNLQDVNKDGRVDLVLFFDTTKLQLSVSSTEATLSGSTLNGTIIWGSDMVRIVPQKK
jgi:hypothetical protein